MRVHIPHLKASETSVQKIAQAPHKLKRFMNQVYYVTFEHPQ